MATALNTDNRFLSGLFTVINNSNPDDYNHADLVFLRGIERIFNMCVDRNGDWHGNDGRYISKGNLAESSYDENKRKLSDAQIEDIKKYVAPQGLDRKNNAEFEKAYLTVMALGLNNPEMQKCFNYSEGSVKIHLSQIYKKYGYINKTDAIVQSAINGSLNLNDIDLFKATRNEYNKKEIDNLIEKLNVFKQGKGKSPLTPAETKCLSWAATGLQNKQIAELYRLDENSKKTTESNIKENLLKVYQKLYANGRDNASAVALKYGLIQPRNISKNKVMYYIAKITGKI